MVGSNGDQSKLENKLRENVRKYREAADPLLAELAHAGFPVQTVGDLRRWKGSYRKAVPVLLRWLPLVKYTSLKRDILGALCTRFARPHAAPVLITEFRKEPNGNWDVAEAVKDIPEKSIGAVMDLTAKRSTEGRSERTSVKWDIGNALSYVANDSVFEDIVELVTDRSHGHDRQMLAPALGNMKNPKAVDTLIDLLDDDQVAGHALRPLGKLRATKARSKIERFLTHNRSWVRHEARLALKRIDAATK
jgi:hypothetical protein